MAGATVRVSPAELPIAPGGQYQLVVTITNLGAAESTFRLGARGIDPSWMSFSPPALHLLSGQEATAVLNLNIPVNALFQSTPLVIRVTSSGVRSVLAETAARLTAPYAAPPTVMNDIQGQPAGTPTVISQVGGSPTVINQTTTERIRTAASEFDEDFSTNPPWALIGAGALALLLLLIGAVYLFAFRGSGSPSSPVPQIAVCAGTPPARASLISDDQTTAILLSDPATDTLKILRTEPGNILPGLFSPLLSLSSDGSKLAYVTAGNEMMDNAQIWYINVASPNDPHLVASVPKGLWPTRPIWSQDGSKLAYVMAPDTAAAQGQTQLELWVVTPGEQPTQVKMQAQFNPRTLYASAEQPLCWSTDNRTIIFPDVSQAGSATPKDVHVDTQTGQFQSVSAPATTTSAAPTQTEQPPSNTATCGVPVFSQNDPAWSQLVMQSGSDTIGGFGCALTSTAMLLNYYGSQVSPDQLNQCLAEKADPIVWAEATACTNGVVSGGDRTEFSWDKLDAVLHSGQPAIVGMLRGQTGSHFVVVTAGGGGAGANYLVTDPWDGTSTKTLQTFFNAGYNPAWIITYNGPGKTCTRSSVVNGAGPEIEGVSDGGVYRNPVTINVAASATDVDSAGIADFSFSSAPASAATPASGTPAVVPAVVLVNQSISLTPIQGSLTLDKDGVYYVMIKHKSDVSAASWVKFTIDHSAPSLDASVSGTTATSAQPPEPLIASIRDVPGLVPLYASVPQYVGSAQVAIEAFDNLSGVSSIEYQLDQGAWTAYSNDTSFRPLLKIDQAGDHTVSIRATDLAGNQSPVKSLDISVVSSAPTNATPSPVATPAATPTSNATPAPQATPTPSPTPSPTPTPAPSPTPTPEPAPVAVIDPTEVTFPGQPMNTTSQPRTVTVTNSGNADLDIQNVELVGEFPDQFRITLDNCSDSTLEPNDVCNVEIVYMPSVVFVQAAKVTAQLQIDDNVLDSPQFVRLTGGVGTAAATEILPANVMFGTTEVNKKSSPFIVTFVNNTQDQLGLKSVDLTGDNAGDFVLVSTTCGTSFLGSRETCNAIVLFNPQSVGNKSATLNFRQTTQTPVTQVTLRGTGIVTVASIDVPRKAAGLF
ncbi:MAG: choice-of-anchor D domain-containing protein [Nitrolancea sp.]